MKKRQTIQISHKKRSRLVGELKNLRKQIGGRIKKFGPKDRVIEKLIATKNAVKIRLRQLKLKQIS